MKQLYFSLKTFFIAGLLMVLLPLAQDAKAQITLAKGDIAFIRVNETTTDAFSIVALANLPAGTNIYFTDNSWGNGVWNGDEGHFLYTVQAGGITAGTVVHFDELSADVLTVTGGSSGTITKSNTGGTGGFSIAGGDQVIAYQSSTGVKPASPFFVAAINTDDGGAVQTSDFTILSNEATGWVSPSNWDLSTKGSQASVLPSGLTNGTDAIGMFPQAGGGAWTSKEVNNMRYDCAKGTSGSKAAMLAKINDPANWVFDDPAPYATSTVCASFTVSSAPATPSPSSNTPVCTGNTINLTTAAVAGATYSWTGPNSFSSSLQNPSINNATAAMAGTYSVTVTVSGTTSAAGTTAVVVNAKPATPSPSTNSPVCTGNTINLSTPAVAGATYSWTGPNGFSSSLQNPSIANATAAMAGTYSVTVTTNGCTSTAGTTAVVVNTKPATPSPSSNTPVCTGNTINLSTPAVAGATYSWTGPNSFSSSLQNPSINNATAAMAGTYSVTVTTNGCTSTAGTTAVVVNAKPATPSPSSNTPVCTGNTINLSTPAVAGATYSWTGPNSFSSSLQNPSINNATAAMAGTYSVTVTTNGCTSTAGTTAVVVNTAPTANNDALTVLGNSAATVVDVLANDQANTLGQTLTVTSITQPANGTATLIAGVVRYTPATGFSGNTSFTYTIAGSICGTSTATVNVTVSPDPLPVTIAKGLTLKKEVDGVRLTWTTATETNNSKFIIYRGGNDTQLAELKMIDGKINSSVLQDYSFLDSRPLIGVNYYRLAQVDLDGKKSILGEKAIEYQIAHPELAVYPNPTTGKITLDFAPKKYQKVQLTSIHGSVLMEQTISSSSSQCSFEMSRLPAGTYLIRLSGTGGVLHSKVVRK